MQVLHIDTSMLRSSATIAEQTNAAISEAASLLNQIIVHEDWVCTEREQIKKMTLANKQKAQQVESHADAFYAAVKSASERFDEKEQELNSRINGVDDVISRVMNVVPGITAASGIGDGISVVEFSDISSALEE